MASPPWVQLFPKLPSLDIQTYSNQGLIKWRQNKKSNRDGFVDFNNPDFVKYAESFGAMGNQVCPVWTTQNDIEGSQVEEFNVMVPGAKATGRVEVTSPFDGKVVGSVPTIDAAGAERALQNADVLFRDRSC